MQEVESMETMVASTNVVLRTGGSEEKLMALRRLAQILDASFGEDADRLCSLVRIDDTINNISNLLDVSETGLHQTALLVVGNLASDEVDSQAEQSRELLGKAGVFPKLLPYLFSDDHKTLAHALNAVHHMCTDLECVELIKKSGCLPRIRSLTTLSDSRVQQFAQGCLATMRQLVFTAATGQQLEFKRSEGAATVIQSYARRRSAQRQVRNLREMRYLNLETQNEAHNELLRRLDDFKKLPDAKERTPPLCRPASVNKPKDYRTARVLAELEKAAERKMETVSAAIAAGQLAQSVLESLSPYVAASERSLIDEMGSEAAHVEAVLAAEAAQQERTRAQLAERKQRVVQAVLSNPVSPADSMHNLLWRNEREESKEGGSRLCLKEAGASEEELREAVEEGAKNEAVAGAQIDAVEEGAECKAVAQGEDLTAVEEMRSEAEAGGEEREAVGEGAKREAVGEEAGSEAVGVKREAVGEEAGSEAVGEDAGSEAVGEEAGLVGEETGNEALVDGFKSEAVGEAGSEAVGVKAGSEAVDYTTNVGNNCTKMLESIDQQPELTYQLVTALVGHVFDAMEEELSLAEEGSAGQSNTTCMLPAGSNANGASLQMPAETEQGSPRAGDGLDGLPVAPSATKRDELARDAEASIKSLPTTKSKHEQQSSTQPAVQPKRLSRRTASNDAAPNGAGMNRAGSSQVEARTAKGTSSHLEPPVLALRSRSSASGDFDVKPGGSFSKLAVAHSPPTPPPTDSRAPLQRGASSSRIRMALVRQSSGDDYGRSASQPVLRSGDHLAAAPSCSEAKPRAVKDRGKWKSYAASLLAVDHIRRALATHKKEVIETFESWDDDTDAGISKIEFQQCLRALLQRWDVNCDSDDIDRLFDSVDNPGAGKVSARQIKQMVAQEQQRIYSLSFDPGSNANLRKSIKLLPPKRLMGRRVQVKHFDSLKDELRASLMDNAARVIDLFKAWDTDGKGMVCRDDFHHAVFRLGFQVPSNEIDELFDEFVEHESGEISIKQLGNILRAGASVQLDPLFQVGGAGEIVLSARTKIPLRSKSKPMDGLEELQNKVLADARNGLLPFEVPFGVRQSGLHIGRLRAQLRGHDVGLGAQMTPRKGDNFPQTTSLRKSCSLPSLQRGDPSWSTLPNLPNARNSSMYALKLYATFQQDQSEGISGLDPVHGDFGPEAQRHAALLMASAQRRHNASIAKLSQAYRRTKGLSVGDTNDRVRPEARFFPDRPCSQFVEVDLDDLNR